ncbi:MAG: type II secretion system F family protein [Aminipila sp.]
MKAKELSLFCMQISFLLEAGIPINSGLAILAEDAQTDEEKDMLMMMSEAVEFGMPFSDAMKKAGGFPDYMVQMIRVGQETGNLEVVTKSLANYYEKESEIAQTIKNAVTYPFIMVCMLVIVLFVLLTKVMPIFEGVYKQLGAELSIFTKTAVQVGSVMSGVALITFAIIAFIGVFLGISAKKGRQVKWANRLALLIKEKSNVAMALAKRRIASVLSMSIKSGLEIESGIEMATELISQKVIKKSLTLCKDEIESGRPMYEAIKSANIFTNLDLQMIKVGARSGKSDVVFEELAKKYENEVDKKIDDAISRFEPTMVVILAVVVGLILLSVMMPLVGVMASIG